MNQTAITAAETSMRRPTTTPMIAPTGTPSTLLWSMSL